ncbi:MAG TPA: carbamoyltransferase C-terminal domain-containing protein [Micromonosporaceae bacterium]
MATPVDEAGARSSSSGRTPAGDRIFRSPDRVACAMRPVNQHRGDRMNILGIHYGSSDAGVCAIVGDRKPIAVALERLDRIKYSGEVTPGWRDNYPEKLRTLLRYCEIGLGMGPGELKFDIVVHTRQSIEDEVFRSVLAPYIREYTDFFRINHHLTHASNAFFASPFDDAAVLVVDGDGDRPVDHVYANNMSEKQSMYRATGNDITVIHKTYGTPDIPCGLGFAYDIVTYHLNFGSLGEAGKTMGLASYGTGALFEDVKIFHRYADGEILMDPEFFHWPEWTLWGSKYGLEEGRNIIRSLPTRFGQVRESGDPLPSPIWNEMAYRIQKELEDAMVELAENLYKITRSPNLCLSGGVALNCIANRQILDRTPFEQIFIQPAASDTGLALGAALYGKHVLGRSTHRWVMTDAYLGREYRDDEVLDALKQVEGITVEYHGPDDSNPYFRSSTPIAQLTARLLAENLIVGWFQGGSEYGPRALGHRSILMDPRRAENKDILNERVKRREGFRPFAPSVLAEFASEYFELDVPSPFMILAAQTREEKADRIPAVVHVDNSARVQTVTRHDNGVFYDLVAEFHRLTGIPVVLNTSFNLAGEPIVETPADALRTFLATHMDHLVIHDYLISKE